MVPRTGRESTSHVVQHSECDIGVLFDHALQIACVPKRLWRHILTPLNPAGHLVKPDDVGAFQGGNGTRGEAVQNVREVNKFSTFTNFCIWQRSHKGMRVEKCIIVFTVCDLVLLMFCFCRERGTRSLNIENWTDDETINKHFCD